MQEAWALSSPQQSTRVLGLIPLQGPKSEALCAHGGRLELGNTAVSHDPQKLHPWTTPGLHGMWVWSPNVTVCIVQEYPAEKLTSPKMRSQSDNKKLKSKKLKDE